MIRSFLIQLYQKGKMNVYILFIVITFFLSALSAKPKHQKTFVPCSNLTSCHGQVFPKKQVPLSLKMERTIDWLVKNKLA